MPKPRIALIVRQSFRAPSDGGSIKTAMVATALARCGELHVLADWEGMAGTRKTVRLPYGGRAVVHHLGNLARGLNLRAELSALERRPAAARSLLWLPREPVVVASWKCLLALEPDVVVADHTFLAPFAVFSPAALRVVNTHNVDSSVRREFGRFSREERARASALAAMEKKLLPAADQVWGVSTSDLAAFRKLGVAKARLRCVPNGLPASRFASRASSGKPGAGLFYGALWYFPNIAAAKAAVKLGGLLHASDPRCRVDIAGAGAPAWLEAEMRAAPGVRYLGFVKDLRRRLRGAAAVVVPIEYGGGTQTKVIEGLANGKPVLTTPRGAAGLGLRDGVHAVVRGLDQSFVDAARKMFQEPKRFAAMGARGLAFARRRYSPEAVQREVSSSVRAGLRAARSSGARSLPGPPPRGWAY